MDVPLKAADKSEWVNYAMGAPHHLASYDAWALTVEELHALAPEPPKPDPAKKTTAPKGAGRG